MLSVESDIELSLIALYGVLMKGILFKPDMIQAIVEGRKTQTRRVIKFKSLPHIKDSDWHAPLRIAGAYIFTARFGLAMKQQRVKYRYQAGEGVYIKEAWWRDQSGGCWGYKLDDIEWPPLNCGGKAISSPFMPAWAARYFIEFTGVRSERLQEISLADIYAEGCPLEEATIFVDPVRGYEIKAQATEWFATLWDSINLKYPWESNPYVWVYKFELVRR